MKTIFLTGVCIICMSVLPAIAQSNDEKAVAAAVETLRKGIVDADRNALEKITADDLVYGHSNGRVQDKAAFIEEIVSKDPFAFVTGELTDQTIKVVGKTSIVRNTFSAETKSPNGAPGKVFLGIMMIWQKQHGKWKLLARQAYKK